MSPSFFDDRISRSSSISTSEESDKQLIERDSTRLEHNLKLQGPYNVYRAVIEIQRFLEVVDKEYHLNSLEREHLKRTRITVDKVFKYNVYK